MLHITIYLVREMGHWGGSRSDKTSEGQEQGCE